MQGSGLLLLYLMFMLFLIFFRNMITKDLTPYAAKSNFALPTTSELVGLGGGTVDPRHRLV